MQHNPTPTPPSRGRVGNLEKLGQSRKNSENTDENTVSTHARTHTHTHIHTHALYAQCYASFAYAVGSRQSGTRRPRRGKTSSTGVITREHVRSSRGLGSQTARPVGGWAETSTARLAHRMSVPTGTRDTPTAYTRHGTQQPIVPRRVVHTRILNDCTYPHLADREAVRCLPTEARGGDCALCECILH